MPRRSDKIKKVRKFSDCFAKYKTYDTSQGFGSVKDWSSQWKAMTGDEARALVGNDSLLEILGLEVMPTLAALKRAYLTLMKVHHPDKGGDLAVAQKIVAAYQLLSEQLGE